MSSWVDITVGLLLAVWADDPTVVAAASVTWLLKGTAQPLVSAFAPDVRRSMRVPFLAAAAASISLAALAFPYSGHAVSVLAVRFAGGRIWRGMAAGSPQGRANVIFGLVITSVGAGPPAAGIDFFSPVNLIVGVSLFGLGFFSIGAALTQRTADRHRLMSDMFGDVRMLCKDLDLMNPVARAIWRLCSIEGPASRYRGEPPSQRRPE